MTKRFVVLVAAPTLAVGLAVGGLANRTADRATASPAQVQPIQIVDGSTYFEEELNSDVTWRLLSNGLLEYKMPRPLLREGEDPDRWFDKEAFGVRMHFAAESRRRGDRPTEPNASSGARGSYRTRDFIVN